MVTSTLTSRGVADVNAVDPHVDIILHVTPLLIIIEHKSSVSPQVEPVSFPPTKYGAFNENMLWSGSFQTGFIYTGQSEHLFHLNSRQYLCMATYFVDEANHSLP